MAKFVFNKSSYEDETFDTIDQNNASLAGIEFYSCIFAKSLFQHTVFKGCLFEDCTFESCNLSLATIVESKFVGISFIDSKLTGINWGGVKGIFTATFISCILNDNIFTNRSLVKFLFQDCSLQGAIFGNVNLKHAKFWGCDLEKCQFDNTDLSFSDFSTSRNYFIDTKANKLHKTKFSLPEAISLLKNLNIILTE